MLKVVVVVPTYWRWERGKLAQSDDIIYDHPIPLDQPGTLDRLLESLKGVDYPDFQVVIVTVATNPALERAAEEKTRRIIRKFKNDFQILQFGISDLNVIHQHLQKLGLESYIPFINLRGYSNVRNIGLIVSHLLGSDVIVGLDDDEIIVDKNYLRIATRFIGKRLNHEFIAGIAGLYLDKQRNYKLSQKEIQAKAGEKNLFQRKEVIMNDAVLAVTKSRDKLVKTPFVFGGNMVIHRKMFEHVPFDPYITRGEDIDYLINGKILGYHFFFDKDLQIIHLPPDSSGIHSAYTYPKLKQDIIRFVYESHKLAITSMYSQHNITLEELDPYPGYFLRKEAEEHAVEALYKMRPKEIEVEEISPEEFVANAKHRAQQLAPEYFKFQRKWMKIMEVLKEDNGLVEYLFKKFFNNS